MKEGTSGKAFIDCEALEIKSKVPKGQGRSKENFAYVTITRVNTSNVVLK
jgi:hypothetical protein